MATAKTEGFRVLPSYYEVMRDLPDTERLKLYDALFDFGFGNEVSDLPPILNSLFRLIKPTLEKSIKFEAKQKANGKKGGRPSKPRDNPDETQTEPKETQSTFGENLAVALANDITIEKETGKPSSPTRKKYGEYGWVRLTEEEYSRLISDLGQAKFDRCVAYIDESAQSTKNKNGWRDWNLILRRCARDGWGRKNADIEETGPAPTLKDYRIEIIDGVETFVMGVSDNV